MNSEETRLALERLMNIMATLRSPDGCPWDAEQTPESLKPYILEEAYEVLEAIDRGEPAAVCDELGDLLLQVVFQARIFEERGEFGMGDVAAAIGDKLVRRHPHVFDTRREHDIAALNAQWERIKDGEKAARGEPTTALSGVPRTLPALLRAGKLVDRASRAGFERSGKSAMFAKVHSELTQFETAFLAGDQQAMENRLGDILFAIVNLGRFVSIDAEQALRSTLDRFTARFALIERALAEEGASLLEATPEKLEALWAEAKANEATAAGGSSKT